MVLGLGKSAHSLTCTCGTRAHESEILLSNKLDFEQQFSNVAVNMK